MKTIFYIVTSITTVVLARQGKGRCDIGKSNYRECMFDKILDQKDEIYLVGINAGYQKSIMIGKTQVIDKRNIVEIPMDPRAWVSDEVFVEHDTLFKSGVIFYTEDIPSVIPNVPSTVYARAMSRKGNERIHRTYAVRR